jgi:putative SOS response-associated peptidase YedK
LLAFAGLYELWRDRTRADDDPQRWLWTCTIITQQASDLLGEIHDRNPVVVPAELRSAWLDCTSEDPATARRLLDQVPEARLEPRVVSAAVGNVRNNGPELIEPIPEPPAIQQLHDDQVLAVRHLASASGVGADDDLSGDVERAEQTRARP